MAAHAGASPTVVVGASGSGSLLATLVSLTIDGESLASLKCTTGPLG